jgi:4-aminobutyrate aminotransferase
MIAMEFDLQQAGEGIASRVAQACLANDMMVLTTSVYETLRFMPPLNISQEETALGLELLERALEDVFHPKQ